MVFLKVIIGPLEYNRLAFLILVCSILVSVQSGTHCEVMSEQILELAPNKAEIEHQVHSIIDRYAERGLRSLGVARQVSVEHAPQSPKF